MFAPLPVAPAEFEELSKSYKGYFTGEHEKVLQSMMKQGMEEAPSKDFTELDRLAYIVSRIEKDTHVVPQGSFKFTPIQEIRKSELFKGTFSVLSEYIGLNKDELSNLAKYQHFRVVETIEKKDLLERNEGVLQTDVFDSLASDKPKGSWSIQLNSGCLSTVRSLLWPGYSFYHMGLTGEYWGVYIGDGVMNKDLPFML